MCDCPFCVSVYILYYHHIVYFDFRSCRLSNSSLSQIYEDLQSSLNITFEGKVLLIIESSIMRSSFFYFIFFCGRGGGCTDEIGNFQEDLIYLFVLFPCYFFILIIHDSFGRSFVLPFLEDSIDFSPFIQTKLRELHYMLIFRYIIRLD